MSLNFILCDLLTIVVLYYTYDDNISDVARDDLL